MNPIVCLVRPKYAMNVGYVSRAMSNLGVDQLVVIEPQCELDIKAFEGAAGGNGPLKAVTICQSWDEFNKKFPDGLRVGLSRRQGHHRVSQNLKDFLEKKNVSPDFLIFGPEDHGLSNDDLKNVHHCALLPVWGTFQSYTLSHAVLLALYILKESESEIGDKLEVSPSAPIPKEIVLEWLQTLGFKVAATKKNALTRLQNIFHRSELSKDDVQFMEKLIYQTVRKIKRDSNDTREM